jgi:hypothetical protein
MQDVAYLLHSEVISNCIIVSITYLFILLIGSLMLLPYLESVLFSISLYLQFLIYSIMDLWFRKGTVNSLLDLTAFLVGWLIGFPSF